jgi:hypothetical protein
MPGELIGTQPTRRLAGTRLHALHVTGKVREAPGLVPVLCIVVVAAGQLACDSHRSQAIMFG